MLITELLDFIINKDIKDKTIFNILNAHRCLNINIEIIRNFFFIANFVDNIFKLHLFTKIYNLKEKTYYTDRGQYICSFYLDNICNDNEYNIDKIENYTNQLMDLDNLIKIKNTSESVHSELGIYNRLYNMSNRNLYDIEDLDESDSIYINLKNDSLLNSLDKMESGIYTNIKDIRWQLYLANIITSSYSDGSLIQFIRSSNFISCKIKEYYYPYTNKNNSFDKEYHNIYNFLCDCCNKNINKNDNSWHHTIAGDLCSNCYSNKKIYERKKQKYINHKILLFCNKILFKQELKRTIEYLEKINLQPLNFKKKNIIQQKVIFELSSKLFENNRRCCPICLDVLNENLSSGKCGHIFHTKCIQNVSDNECPLCKIETDFYKLYLYN